MKVVVDILDRVYRADLSRVVDIAIPMRFGHAQPVAFGVAPAEAEALQVGDTKFSTREGASCNVDVITVIPHCNGTHTECVGHIVNEEVAIPDMLQSPLLTCRVVSIEPDSGSVITAASIGDACRDEAGGVDALAIRTLPNLRSKLERDYAANPAPYLAPDAVKKIVELGFDHLIVDIPSLDPADDGGLMEAHRAFWNVPTNVRSLDDDTAVHRTVTELAFIPDSAADGLYLVNLQIAPFASDAAPSRPVLVPLER